MMRTYVERALLAAAMVLLSPLARGAPIENEGPLSSADGNPLEGEIVVFSETPHFGSERHEVGKDGSFRFGDNSADGRAILARAAGHAYIEHHDLRGQSGTIRAESALPAGQEITGRGLDGAGRGVEEATVQIRYHEPNKSSRRVFYDEDLRTDGDGTFLARTRILRSHFFRQRHPRVRRSRS